MAAQSLSAAGVTAPAPRVLGDWRGSASVAIAHSKPILTSAAIDLGAASANQPLGRMLLLLAPSPAQQQALAAELASQQNPSSSNYHHWLTPQAFAQSYANNASDVSAVVAWLQSQGFTVAPLPAGLGWIEFSGTVGQVEQAFGAQIHLISINGNRRAVLTTGITVPSILSPVIAGLASLDGVLATPALTAPQPLTVSVSDLASLTSPTGAAAFTPQLAAQFLDAAPLTTQGVNGSGQTIAIVSRSNVNSSDVAAFRSAFALPASPLQVSLNGPDPGLSDDQAEATLAASWAGAAAPGAQILLVPAAATNATDGVDLSLAAVVDQDLANVIAVGYSACEASLSPAHQAFYSALYQQAAAEGITVVAATGDGGAAACTPAGGTTPVSTGLAVNGLAASPWNIAVGVAGFGAGGAAAGPTTLTAWSPTNPANPDYAPADPAYASGGGSSTLYARKAWQPTPSGLATSSHYRSLPDLTLPTALDSAINPGLAFCLSGSSATTGCTLVRSGGSGVATAFFAGVAALINQKNGVQGSLAPSLYATSHVSGVFNDVAQGTAQLACVPGSSGCDANGLIGYPAGSGYDLATGLGVPDVQKLVTELAKPQALGSAPSMTLSISPTQSNNTYNPSALVTFTARVFDPSAAGIPSGGVDLYDTTNLDVLTPLTTLNSTGSANTGSTATIGPIEMSSFYNYSGPQSFTLGVGYSGDSNYPATDSGYLLSATTELSPTTLTIMPSTTSPALGSNVTVTTTLSIVASGPPAGSVSPTGSVTLTVNGTALNPVALSTTGSVTSASFTVPITAASNSMVASYAGDSNYGSTTTNPYLLTASKAATTVTLTSSATSIQPGMPVTLTATVAPVVTPASGLEQNPSGTVIFYSGSTEIGSETVTAGPGINNATATLTTSTLPNGSDSITAIYEGDTTYATSTSTALTVSVAKAQANVVLTANSTTVQPGVAVVLTVTVTPTIAPIGTTEPNPTGTVYFYDGTTVIGMAQLTAVALNDSSTATLTTQTLPGGSDSITAVYQGDSTYGAGTSNVLIVDVQGFTLTASPSNPPTNLNITKGGAGSESFVVTSIGGYSGQVQVICTVPTQDDMSCVVSPQVVTPTATVTFVVETYVTGGPAYASLYKPTRPGPLWPQAAGGAMLAGLVFFLLPFGRRARTFLRQGPQRLVVLLMLLAGLAGAAIGCTSTAASTTVNDVGTPLGVATLEVTATAYVDNAVVAQNLYFTVNVQPQ